MSAILKVISVTIGIVSLVLFQYQDPKGLEDQPLLSSNVSEWLRQGQFLNVFGHQMYYRICGHSEENEKDWEKMSEPWHACHLLRLPDVT